MRIPLFQSQKLIVSLILCASLFFPYKADAQDSIDAEGSSVEASKLPPDDYIVPAPRTITAELPVKAPEKVVEIYWHNEENQICIDTFKLSLSRSVIVRNTPVSARVRISRKCDDRAKSAPVPVSATLSTRSGQKSGPSETIRPDGTSFAYTVNFPNAGSWQLTIVMKYDGNENYTVTVPVKVLAEPPVVTQPSVQDDAV